MCKWAQHTEVSHKTKLSMTPQIAQETYMWTDLLFGDSLIEEAKFGLEERKK